MVLGLEKFNLRVKVRRRLTLFVAVSLCFLEFSCGGNSAEKALATPGATLPIGSLDTPPANAIVRGVQLFGGWGAHSSGIAFVAIYLDGNYIVSAALGGDRPDVIRALPQFKPDMISGWNVGVDTRSWPPGPHQVIAKVVSKSGVDRDLPISFSVVK